MRHNNEKELLEERLKESEDQYRAIAEDTPALICRFDPNGEISYVNRAYCQYFSKKTQELVGINFLTLIPESDRKTVINNISSLTVENPILTHEHPVLSPEGHIRWQKWTNRGLFDNNGNVRAYQSIGEDITDRKNAEEALQASNQQLAASNQQLKATEQQLRASNQQLQATEQQLRAANDQLAASNQLLRVKEHNLKIKNQLKEIFLTISDDGMYYEVLKVVLEAMESKFGVFGYIDENGDFVVPSMTRHIWSQCNILEKTIVFPRDKWGCSSWPRAIREKKTNYTNDESKIVPEGHIPIRRHISVPIIFRDEVIGLFQIANKETDYTEEDIEFLEEIGNVVAPILNVRLYRDRLEKKQKEMEESLRLSEQKYHDLYDNAPDMHISVDANNETIIDCNQTMLKALGYTREEVVNRPIFEIYASESAKYAKKEVFPSLKKNGKVEDIRLQVQKKNLDIINVNLKATAVYDKDGNIKQSRSVLRDVTEKELLEKQLIQAQKMESVGRLAGGVAHDFNNMLSIIIGYAESALEKLDPEDTLTDDITEIFEAGKRSADITRQLLAFARKQTTAPKVLELNDNIEGMLKMLRRLIGEDIDLSWLPGAELWPVKIDPSQIDQILANLCVNARDAIKEVGQVTIETKNINFDIEYCADHAGFIPGDYVMLAVSDSGSGMPPETIDKIFEPFFTTKKLHHGTGLGLSTVYGIVKQNNGFINVYSELENGTTIKSYLPRYAGQTVEMGREGVSEAPLSRGETILLVEDDKAILKLGQKMLNSLGYTVLSASTPSEAIRLGEKHINEISLLLTDVVMPEMNGQELSDMLQRKQPDIKTLYMSGYTANVIAHRGVLEDGVVFIPKPISKKELSVKIRMALENTNG